MQNWRSFVGSGRRVRVRLVGPGRSAPDGRGQASQLVARSLNTRASLPTISSQRGQSTTRANLATASAQVAPSPRTEECELDVNSAEHGEQLRQSTLDAASTPEAHRFLQRHLGPRREDLEAMLGELGYSSLEDLIKATVPEQILLRRELELPEPINEQELVERLRELGAMNAPGWRNFIGMGYYDCVTPPAILRNMFENPGWSTAYTAYQAEIAQGRLEGLMNYQTMVCNLTGMDVANASLLDEATAAAEALQVCLRQDTKRKRNRWLVSSRCHPQTLAVVESRAKGLGVQVDQFDELDGGSVGGLDTSRYSGLLVQYPNTEGHLFELDRLTEQCHSGGCLVVVATDLLACTLFKPPGDFQPHRPDLAVGSSQRLGVPLNFGGPHAAFLACKQELVRSIPGRVVGLTRDSNGQQAYRFALQTREQHIRRDKATSNICTAQALLANMSAMYAVYHGPEGLRQIAGSIHAKASLLAHLLARTRRVQLHNQESFFDTLTLSVDNLADVKHKALSEKINLRYYNNSSKISISLDETTKLADIFCLLTLFPALSETNPESDHLNKPLEGKLSHLKRSSSYLTHPTFNSHRSEAQLVRYMKRLENKDISLAHSMIPLGSCTMKLNATSQMLASSWPQFANAHPYQPVDQCKGYLQLFQDLNDYLCEITGYDRISFQPNSGAQGEYAGLRAIKSYLVEARREPHRQVCLIPVSAHGTNPASAQMAGFKIQTIRVLDDGNIDMDDLRANIERHGDQLACLMVTYPSTFGVFEESIAEVCDLVHEAGGQVYLDGANMNAQVGLCRPGDYGSDVSHLNLHKTFCIPHGGGGPGAGPIGVKNHLAPYLPGNPLSANNHRSAVSASMWGSPAILPISWSYIRLMGRDLKLSSQVAILNANYMRRRLEQDYKILFRGVGGNVAHEFILDCRPFKKTANVEATDIAKRLQDFGLHAPTVSWPVANTLMLEPTESEDKHQLDRYCDALLTIREEIRQIESGQWDKLDNPVKNAPHTQQTVCSSHWTHSYSREQAAYPNQLRPDEKLWPTVGRVDDTYGDTNLFCTCPPTSSS